MRDFEPALDSLEPLRRFRDERGRELLDLPRAPLPGGDVPAPVRFLPRYDNLVLSHADRTRVVADEHRRTVIHGAGMVEATFLVDGFVAGLWREDGGRVRVEPFAPLPRGRRRRGRGRGGATGSLAALMQIGAHVSSSGGIDKADRPRGRDRAPSRCRSSPRARARGGRRTTTRRASSGSARSGREAGIGGVVCHALYLCNLAAPDDAVYEKSVAALRNTMEVACAIGADGVVFHVGSHLGSGFETGLERVVPALEQVLELCSDETWLLMENSAGAGGTIGRSISELAAI